MQPQKSDLSFPTTLLFALWLLAFASPGYSTQCAESNLPAYPDVVITQVSTQSTPTPHCKVAGRIGPEINFELLLPEEWNGKFVMGGGGGFVGSVQNTAFRKGALQAGYATVGTDTGHSGGPVDAEWALNNQERIVNFGHQAIHRTATTAKALTRAYYGKSARRNYFLGCSRGGGQALMSAQRYPEDFDGIVAGAPAYNWTGLAAQGVQIQQAMFPDPGNLTQALVKPADQEMLAQAILAQCDAVDGISDGILNDPPKCDFKVESLSCAKTNNPDQAMCLPAEKIAAIRRVYDGPSDAQGSLFYGFPFGGENDPAGWTRWLTGGIDDQSQQQIPNLHFGFGNGIMKYMVYHDANWDYSNYEFSGFRSASRPVAATLNATNPDLSSFRARGGKLLIYHGWSDPAITALGTIGYVNQVLAHDPQAARDVRLFMMPGVLHCNGGYGPSHANFLEEIDKWVESNDPPEQIDAFFGNSSDPAEDSRPLCAYPNVANYDGTGNARQSGSFTCGHQK